MSAGYDDDSTRGTYNTTRAKTRLETRQQNTTILAAVFTVIGGALIAAALVGGLDDYPHIALFNAGLASLVWAGLMVIAWGALSGHVALFRLIEHCTREGVEKMETAIDLEERTSRIIGDVLEDDLARKRDSRRN